MKKKDETRWVSARFNGKKYLSSYSSVKSAMEALQEAMDAETSGEWKDLCLDIEHDYGDSHELVIRGKRLETDAERAQRENQERAAEDYRRKMYEQLKKEFGDK